MNVGIHQLLEKIEALERRVKLLEDGVQGGAGVAASSFPTSNEAPKQEAVPPAAEPDPQLEDGFEIFLWKGFKYFRCSRMWESGARCEFTAHEKAEIIKHAASPHTRDGKPAERSKQVVSPLVDHEGKQIIREVPVPAGYENAKFKE